jgi:hypothetical protein
MTKTTNLTGHKLSIEVVLVTPQVATEYLAANGQNRNISVPHLARLVSAMKSDEFIVGDSIKFDFNGALIDGQHRLTAIIKTGKSIHLSVVRGYAPEAKGVLDIGKRRSSLNIAKLQGHDEIGSRDISCMRSMLLPYASAHNKRNALTVAQEIDLTLKFLESIQFVTNHPFMRGSLSRTAVAGTIARAHLSGNNYQRLTQFMDIFGGQQMTADKQDLAAVRLRESFLSRNADRRRSLTEEFQLTQSALKAFLARQPRKFIQQTGGNVFSTPTLDEALEAIAPGFAKEA